MKKYALLIAAIVAANVYGTEKVDSTDGRYYRLFTPLTFYHTVANNNLSLNSNDSKDAVDEAIDNALLNIYLNRPELVKTTDSQLNASGSLRNDIEKPIVQEVELTEYAEPMPEEPKVVTSEVKITKPRFWTRKGDGYLQFMQNYVSDNWYKGGESTYSLLGSLTLEANYDNKGKWKWDNKLEAKLGFLTAKSDSLHKWKTNEDQIRLTSKVGLQASKRWYYTLQLLAWTQFTRGLKSNDHRVYSDFLSPLNVNAGLGMDYKVEAFNKRLTGTVNLSPLALNFRYVDRTLFPKQNSATPTDYDWFPSRHGIEQGKHHLLDPGSQITADLKWKLSETVSWKSRFWAFTSYKRAEVEWENTFQLKVSKYITANIFLYPRFDDGSKRDEDLGYWQFKEYTSIGVSYTF